jgi:RND family efflux transporter MFP subunit
VAIPNTLASGYSGNENAYQNAITNQASAITSAQQQITSAENKVQQDEINLQVQQQPPTTQAVESAQASLINAQASLQNAELAYNNNILKAPFDGTIAQLNNQVGDQVTGSTDVAVETTTQSIAVIPLNEVDVAKVAVGDKVSMTFDAIDGLTITGTVVQIDNIGTVSQGVVSYNVKITFDTEDPRVKTGMSINASIITNIAADVLTVPSSAIQTQGTTSYVLMLSPADTETVAGQTGVIAKVAPTRVTVQTGVSDDTNTQITSGSLKAGDSIVVQTITATATKSAASTATSALRLGGATGGLGGGAGFTGATRTGAAAAR